MKDEKEKVGWIFILLALAIFVLGVNLGNILSGGGETGGPLCEGVAVHVPRLGFVEAHAEGASTWFGVKMADSLGTEPYTTLEHGPWYAMVEPLFIVEEGFEGVNDTAKILRSPTVIVQLHNGIVTGTEPVPYRKEDLWKIWATVMEGHPGRYEFVQESWLEFDPARDMK